MIRILVVEDDEKLNKIVCTYLNDSGFQATGCLNARDAYDEMYSQLYDLIISDIMMPEIDGFEFAKTVRKVNERIPILFMSAKDDLPSKQRGFRLGIDDYMVKPVDLNEMLLRVNALLRRAKIVTERKLTIGSTVLNYDTYTAEYNGRAVEIPQKEFLVLYKLMSYPSRTFTRRQLMDEFWGYDTDSEERTVDVHINRLRERLKDCPDIEIDTIRGLGYRGVKKCD